MSEENVEKSEEKMSQVLEKLANESEDTLSSMFLTFRLSDEYYGIEIRYVTEIVGMQQVTEVPDMPPFVKGVVNLRGQVIPVLDMRLRFNMMERSYDERTCIIVVNINSIQVGLVVDTISEVRNIDEGQISPPPNNSPTYIQGMAKVGDLVIILLEGQQILMEHEMISGSDET